jgi:hypothetical protein
LSCAAQINFGSELVQEQTYSGVKVDLPLLTPLLEWNRTDENKAREQLQQTMNAAYEVFRAALLSTDFQSRLQIKTAPMANKKTSKSSPPDGQSTAPTTIQPTTTVMVTVAARNSADSTSNSPGLDDEALDLYSVLAGVAHVTHQLMSTEALDHCIQASSDSEVELNKTLLAVAKGVKEVGSAVSIPLVGMVVSALGAACALLLQKVTNQQLAANALLEAVYELHKWLRHTLVAYQANLPFKQQALPVQQFPYVVKYLHLALEQVRSSKEWSNITKGINDLLSELNTQAKLDTAAGVASVRKQLANVGHGLVLLQQDIRHVGEAVFQVS